MLVARRRPRRAHKASDSYLQIAAAPGQLDVRWDIALRDLDAALDLDTDADGKLTWGEVRAAWPRIEAYALRRLAIEGCPLAPIGRGLERRNDGAYAVLIPALVVHADGDAANLVRPFARGRSDASRHRQGPAAGQQVAPSVLDPSAAMAVPWPRRRRRGGGGAAKVAADDRCLCAAASGRAPSSCAKACVTS